MQLVAEKHHCHKSALQARMWRPNVSATPQAIARAPSIGLTVPKHAESSCGASSWHNSSNRTATAGKPKLKGGSSKRKVSNMENAGDICCFSGTLSMH